MRFKLVLALMLLAAVGASGELQVMARVAPAPGGGGIVNLPYNFNDNTGNQWMIFQQGWLRIQGNMPLYSQAANLNINGNGLSCQSNQGRVDEKSGELILENMNAANIQVTRRIRVDRADGYVRYIDIFRNTQPQDQSVQIQINSNFNYGVQTSQSINDPKIKDRAYAWTAQLHAGRSIVEVYAGKGAKVAPQINAQPNNNVCTASLQLTIPANQQVALMHLHATSASQESAVQFAGGLKESQLVADLPIELRKIIVNIAPTQSIGDREVLRGEVFDVIELRGGDQLKGTLAETSYTLETFYGTIKLPAERVVGLINVGQFKPRQLLVTVDGEVFGGALDRPTIGIELSSGQTTQVPLSQIERFGYRKRAGEPDEWSFSQPMIRLRSGERMLVALPGAPIEVMTRYGLFKLKPEAVANLWLQSEEHGVHTIELTDGSSFAGLIPQQQFQLQLTGTAAQQPVSFGAAAVARLQLSSPPDDLSSALAEAAMLHLTNQDKLVGTLAGELKLTTLFDTITINASEVRGLVHAPDSGLDVQVTLWDQTTVSGQLHDPEVLCELKCGVSVKIPVPLIDRYVNSQPNPSASIIARVRAVVGELSADDWKQRERAEAQLVAMGPIVMGVLKELCSAQPPEAQQRIDSILKQLESQKASATSVGAGRSADR